MHYLLALAGSVTLATAHGIIDSMVIDGTTYPAFDPRVDLDFKGVKSINWGYQKTSAEGTGPVEDVQSPDITCRFNPLIPPAIHAMARAGATISFKWTEWFANHKGPLLTYMGLMPDENVKVQDVEFFKIDESTYDPATETWGSDQLIKDNNIRTMKIPSDIKPGMYVIRHELISLHFAFRENNKTRTSGAQFYPTCLKVQVIGNGTAAPPGQKFPGAYHWNDEGILDNIYYGVNRYISPGPPVYKGPGAPPQGLPPVVLETGEMIGEQGEKYKAARLAHGKKLLDSVAADIAKNKPGGGGCHWEVGKDPSTAKCVPTNPGNPAYVGFAQPKGSPLYTTNPGSASNGMLPPPPKFNNRVAVEFQG